MKFIKNYLGAAFLLFFLLFWSTLTLIFDCQTLRGMTEQLRTLSFQEAQGQLLQSSVETHEDSDGGDMYRLQVQYRYQVGGMEYTSHTYRFGNLSSNDKFAHQRSEELASKTNVTVYYNPAIPQQAVLVRGIEGLDLFCLLFMTPFNMVMLAGW